MLNAAVCDATEAEQSDAAGPIKKPRNSGVSLNMIRVLHREALAATAAPAGIGVLEIKSLAIEPVGEIQLGVHEV